MDEFLAGIVVAIIEILAEFLAELISALIADGLTRLFRAMVRSSREVGPVWSTTLFALAGVGLGLTSMLIYPHPLVHPSRFHGLSLIVSPLAAGAMMALLGRSVRRAARTSVSIESFRNGATFAFAFALVRFVLLNAAR